MIHCRGSLTISRSSGRYSSSYLDFPPYSRMVSMVSVLYMGTWRCFAFSDLRTKDMLVKNMFTYPSFPRGLYPWGSRWWRTLVLEDMPWHQLSGTSIPRTSSGISRRTRRWWFIIWLKSVSTSRLHKYDYSWKLAINSIFQSNTFYVLLIATSLNRHS